MRGLDDGSAVMAGTDEAVLWWVDGCAVMEGTDEAVLWWVRCVVEAAPRPGGLVDMARDGLGWVVADAAGSLVDGLAPAARGLSVSGVGAVKRILGEPLMSRPGSRVPELHQHVVARLSTETTRADLQRFGSVL